MTTVKKARGGPLPALKRFVHSKHMVTLVWILGIVVVWEIFACIVAATKRTPVNVLPHLYEIIGSFFSDKKVTGKMTMIELIGTACGETLSRAGIGFLAGIAAGYILALLMNLSRVVEKIAFPYLMIIQMIPILGMAPIILSITGDINSARIVIAAILTFYPVSTNVLAGFRSVEKEKHELMYSYAANKFQLYTKTLIPACIPYFFTGLKISAPMAITASILVDTLQGGNGLGCMLSQSLKGGMTRLVFWDIVLISAVIASIFRKWGAGGLTIVSAFNAIPIVALAPVINNWTRDVSNDVSIRSTLAKIIVVTISCTAAMSVNAFRGLTELKPFSEDLMTSYAAPKIVVFTKLRLPNSLAYVFTALRVSVPASVIGALVTEYFAEDTVGVGRQIRENIVKGQYPTAWAYIATACAIGIGMYIILMLVERLVLKRRKA